MLLVNLAYCLAQPTGTTTYAYNLLPHLRALDPLCLSSSLPPGIPAPAHQPVPPTMTAAQGSRGHLRRLWWTQTRLPQIYHQQRARLVFCPIPEAPLYRGVATVVTVHDLIPLRFYRPLAPLRLYCRHVLPQVLAQAQHVICNSATTAQDLIDQFGISAQRITPIPLAPNTQQFRWLRQPTANYFVCLGRCAPYKNWERVIAALAQLPKEQNYELWLVGPPDPRYRPALLAQAQALGVDRQVKFVDFLPAEELPVVLNAALALVFPSLWEGFGLPILEAMACGTPVITADRGAMAEVAGDSALLVDPYRPEEIATAMAAVGNSTALREQLRQQGLARVQQFSWQRTGEETRQILARYL